MKLTSEDFARVQELRHKVQKCGKNVSKQLRQKYDAALAKVKNGANEMLVKDSHRRGGFSK